MTLSRDRADDLPDNMTLYLEQSGHVILTADEERTLAEAMRAGDLAARAIEQSIAILEYYKD